MMNQRIKELWNQSRYPSGRGHDEEKFAELIVKECAKVCRDQPDIFAGKLERDNCAIAIEDHFGVEVE